MSQVNKLLVCGLRLTWSRGELGRRTCEPAAGYSGLLPLPPCSEAVMTRAQCSSPVLVNLEETNTSSGETTFVIYKISALMLENDKALYKTLIVIY